MRTCYALGIAMFMAIFSTAICGFASAETADEVAIKKILTDGCKAFVEGDAAGAVAVYLPSDNLMVFDISPPREKGLKELQEFNKQLIDAVSGKPTCVYEEIKPVILTNDYAYSASLLRASGTLKTGGTFSFLERSTDIFKKVDGTWKVIHEHNSVPVDVMTGKADLNSAP